jgi:hypothetical protein
MTTLEKIQVEISLLWKLQNDLKLAAVLTDIRCDLNRLDAEQHAAIDAERAKAYTYWSELVEKAPTYFKLNDKLYMLVTSPVTGIPTGQVTSFEMHTGDYKPKK